MQKASSDFGNQCSALGVRRLLNVQRLTLYSSSANYALSLAPVAQLDKSVWLRNDAASIGERPLLRISLRSATIKRRCADPA